MPFQITHETSDQPLVASNNRLNFLRQKPRGQFQYFAMLVALALLWIGLAADGINGESLPLYPWIGAILFDVWVISMIGELRRVDRPYHPARSAFYLLLLSATLGFGVHGIFGLWDTPLIRYGLSLFLLLCAIVSVTFYLSIHTYLRATADYLRPRALTVSEISYAVLWFAWFLIKYFFFE